MRGSCPRQAGMEAGIRSPLLGGVQSFLAHWCLLSGLQGRTIKARSLGGLTTGYPGNKTGPNCWLCGARNIPQKQVDFLDSNLDTPIPRVGLGDLGRQRAAGYYGYEIQTSCPMRGSSAPATPAICSQPPQPFYSLQIILQSATEAIPSSEVWEKAV